MDIRTKLVFTLVAVSLGSMAALGVIAYSTSGELLEHTSVRQLEALAASKKQDLEQTEQAWRQSSEHRQQDESKLFEVTATLVKQEPQLEQLRAIEETVAERPSSAADYCGGRAPHRFCEDGGCALCAM